MIPCLSENEQCNMEKVRFLADMFADCLVCKTNNSRHLSAVRSILEQFFALCKFGSSCNFPCQPLGGTLKCQGDITARLWMCKLLSYLLTVSIINSSKWNEMPKWTAAMSKQMCLYTNILKCSSNVRPHIIYSRQVALLVADQPWWNTTTRQNPPL